MKVVRLVKWALKATKFPHVLGRIRNYKLAVDETFGYMPRRMVRLSI